MFSDHRFLLGVYCPTCLYSSYFCSMFCAILRPSHEAVMIGWASPAFSTISRTNGAAFVNVLMLNLKPHCQGKKSVGHKFTF